MAKAIWNGQTLAESETYQTVEGNIYFPDESVKRQFFRASSTTSATVWAIEPPRHRPWPGA